MLIQHRQITPSIVQKITSWHHWGFSIHNQVHIPPGQSHSLSALVQYIIRPPISQERILTKDSAKTLIYRGSKFHPLLQINFQVFDPLDWIATFTAHPVRNSISNGAHIPDKGQHLVRYYGFYSNVCRGKRKKLSPPLQTHAPPSPLNPSTMMESSPSTIPLLIPSCLFRLP